MGRGSRGRAFALSFFCAAALALPVLASAAAKVKPATLPLTITLPSGWSVTGNPPGAKFAAAGGAGHLAVTSGGTFPEGVPFSEFVQTEGSSAKTYYRGKDPHASLSTAKVSLPSGPAVLTKVSYKVGGGGLSVYLYSLLHNGVTYHVTFWAPSSSIGSEKGAFASAAKSIHFSK